MILAVANIMSVPEVAFHKEVYSLSDSCEWLGDMDTKMSIGKCSQNSIGSVTVEMTNDKKSI